MRSAAVSKLKATLSEYIAFVKAGEEIMVTERGKPVAKIVPLSGAEVTDARRMVLARKGLLRLGKGRIRQKLIDELPIASIDDATLARIIEEEREDRL